jgi:hypothetical protein
MKNNERYTCVYFRRAQARHDVNDYVLVVDGVSVREGRGRRHHHPAYLRADTTSSPCSGSERSSGTMPDGTWRDSPSRWSLPSTIQRASRRLAGARIPPWAWMESGRQSPGKAVLTIGDVSYTFGGSNFSTSGIWRGITGQCSSSLIGMYVTQQKGFFDFAPQVDVRTIPRKASR